VRLVTVHDSDGLFPLSHSRGGKNKKTCGSCAESGSFCRSARGSARIRQADEEKKIAAEPAVR
jgi:hypothetical protein